MWPLLLLAAGAGAAVWWLSSHNPVGVPPEPSVIVILDPKNLNPSTTIARGALLGISPASFGAQGGKVTSLTVPVGTPATTSVHAGLGQVVFPTSLSPGPVNFAVDWTDDKGVATRSNVTVTLT
jgi:hypothetical protein